MIHRDRNETAAIGNPGRELGYGGIANSLAVEFDTWYNPDTNTTTTGVDMIVDHVSQGQGQPKQTQTKRLVERSASRGPPSSCPSA